MGGARIPPSQQRLQVIDLIVVPRGIRSQRRHRLDVPEGVHHGRFVVIERMAHDLVVLVHLFVGRDLGLAQAQSLAAEHLGHRNGRAVQLHTVRAHVDPAQFGLAFALRRAPGGQALHQLMGAAVQLGQIGGAFGLAVEHVAHMGQRVLQCVQGRPQRVIQPKLSL